MAHSNLPASRPKFLLLASLSFLMFACSCEGDNPTAAVAPDHFADATPGGPQRGVAEESGTADPFFDTASQFDALDGGLNARLPSVDSPILTPDGPDSSPPTSLFCPDTLRDPVTEECDDGPGTTNDSCTPDCRSRNTPVVADNAPLDAGTPTRTLGNGPHVTSTGTDGFAVVYTEQDALGTTVHLQPFTQWGAHSGAPLTVSTGTDPTAFANPVVAALSASGTYAVAWTEASGGTPDVVLKFVVANQEPTNFSRYAHDLRSGPQQDPDVLWTGQELIVAWTDLFTVAYRRFSAGLSPLDVQQPLFADGTLQSNVTLAPFATSWAAAWRSGNLGLESIIVRAGDTMWSTEAALPGPQGDRPALVELDDGHLLLLYTVGTDPFGGSPANVGRLRVAVIDSAAPGTVTSAPLTILTPPYDTDVTLSQRRPSAMRVGERVFIAWETESPTNDPLESEVWLQEIRWTAAAPGVIESLDERPLQIDAPRIADQRSPALGTSPLFPEGALIMVHEDWSGDVTGRGGPELVLGFRPTPFVTLEAADGGAPLAMNGVGL